MTGVQTCALPISGKLTIGASFTLGEYVLPRILAAFADRYPEVRFKVTIGNTELVHERIREGSIDIGLVEGLIEDTDLYIRTFLQDEMVLVVSKKHPLARKTFVVKDDLADSTFIMREEGSGTRLAVEELLHRLDLQPCRVITLGSTQAIKEAVESGLGISFLSKWTLRKELQLGTLKPVRVKDVDITRGLYVLQNQEKFESRACAEFAAFVTAPDIIRLLG